MSTRSQQVYAGRRKYGQGASIVSILTANEHGTPEYKEWKEKEKNEGSNLQLEIDRNQKERDLEKVTIMGTIFRHQMGRLQLQRIVDLYPIAWKRCAIVYSKIREQKLKRFVSNIKIHLHVIHVQRKWRHKQLMTAFVQDIAATKLQLWWRVYHQIRYRKLHRAGTRIAHWMKHVKNTTTLTTKLKELSKTKKIARFMTRLASSNSTYSLTHHFHGWKRFYEEVVYNKLFSGSLSNYATSLVDLQKELELMEKNDPTKLEPPSAKDVYLMNNMDAMRAKQEEMGHKDLSSEAIELLVLNEFLELTTENTPKEVYQKKMLVDIKRKKEILIEEEMLKEGAYFVENYWFERKKKDCSLYLFFSICMFFCCCSFNTNIGNIFYLFFFFTTKFVNSCKRNREVFSCGNT